MSTVYLGLGTNLGDRLGHLRNAVAALARCCRVTAVSKVYETAPIGITDQPAFLNIALKAETDLETLDLLTTVKDMEIALGRTQTVRWGPRVIDIDILLYDDRQMNEPALDVPHPRLCERRFALAPLADVAADVIHPANGQTIAQLLDRLPNDDDVKVLSDSL